MPAQLVAVFNQKGGCAKTMTTMQLAGTLGMRGFKVLVVDMDRQGTSMIWSAQAEADDPFPAEVVSLAPLREKMIGELAKRAPLYDLVFIDCPPAIDSPIPWAALNVADLALIPVVPVMDNVWASREAKELALKARQENPALRAYYLASMVRRGRLFDLCLQELRNDADIPMLESYLSLRNAFAESQLYGAVVGSIAKKSPAALEADALADEVLALLAIKPKKPAVRAAQRGKSK
ncbi:chromosome partitioning protein [Methylomagnum ishizawai]|uniref:Chromosome partitioning protein n=1 Tax=Methylomagnum ishizawai TaxID=1760988 RepID=A0A1Y6DC33_9GAMM|nr:ParA family protein [Methylomagnum ishizawai]SMF97634.1 chromosome partitioning protein [Methylomagnum ishizawai]